MAAPEPSPSIARIVSAQDPGGAFYVVYVRVPQHLLSKFPDKPWGTLFENVGVVSREAAHFTGYSLVEIEPIQGSSDLLWIFQKLPGPVWTTSSTETENLTPAQFRKFIKTKRTKQAVATATLPDTVGTVVSGAGLTAERITSSAVQDEDNTGRAVKVTTTEQIGAGSTTLTGQIAYEQRQVATTEDSLVADGTAADSGLLVAQSRVSPLGNGTSVKETVKVDAWVPLTASRWDGRIKAQVPRTEQFVTPPTVGDLALNNTSFEIVNQHRALKVVETPPTNLATYMVKTPSRVSLDLPRVLKSATVVWDIQESIGSQAATGFDYASGVAGSVSLSLPDSASSSVSMTGDLLVTYEDTPGTSLPAQTWEFYIEGYPTISAILTRVGGSPWPVFRPQSHTVSINNCAVSVRANVQVGASSSWNNDAAANSYGQTTSSSDDFDIRRSVNVVQIPPCIGTLNVTGQLTQTREVVAFANMSITSRGNPITATAMKKHTAVATVNYTPGGASQTIPTSGLYVIDADATPIEYGNWFRVTAIVFDASVLA